MAIKSQGELYEEFKDEVQAQDPDLTDFSDGSDLDLMAGVVASVVNETSQVSQDSFRKTFIDTAHGPEVTGGPDDLQTLAVDHFGDEFIRPAGVKATGTVTFTRPNDDAGNVVIEEGTIVKTPQSASGNSQRFETTSEVTMTGTTINASVRAVLNGPGGNVLANKVTQIETALTDPSITVDNSAAFTGGQDAYTDAQYRDLIKSKIKALQAGTENAIVAAALTVGGVVAATLVEIEQYVMEWDIAEEQPIGDYFAIPRSYLYISDVNGEASQTLIDDVHAEVDKVRATGVRIEVLSGVALELNWTVSVVLNPTGPNYATLQADTTMLEDEMNKYISELPIGTDFVRATAEAYMMAKFGPSGTDDLTDISTSIPIGDVDAEANEKFVPGTIAVV